MWTTWYLWRSIRFYSNMHFRCGKSQRGWRFTYYGELYYIHWWSRYLTRIFEQMPNKMGITVNICICDEMVLVSYLERIFGDEYCIDMCHWKVFWTCWGWQKVGLSWDKMHLAQIYRYSVCPGLHVIYVAWVDIGLAMMARCIFVNNKFSVLSRICVLPLVCVYCML